MNNLNQSLDLFKKKFFYFILVDSLFFILLFISLNFSRNRIQGYLSSIQQYIPQLNEVQKLLQESTVVGNLEQSNILLENINSVMNEALFFGYFIMPLIIFVLWITFQGLSYKLISEDNLNKILDYKYFIKFSILTLPFFILLTLAIFQFLAMFSDLIPYYGGIFKPTIMLFIITLGPIILFYFLLIFYSLLNKNSLLKTLKKGFLIAIKSLLCFITLIPLILYFLFILYISSINKSDLLIARRKRVIVYIKRALLFSLYLLYLIIFILFLVAFLNNLVFYIGNFNAFSTFNLVITIVLLIAYSYYRILFSSFSSSFSS